MEEIIYVPTYRYVYFDKDGELLSIGNIKDETRNYITVELNEVINLITGKEVISDYIVLFDTVTKQHVLRSRFIEEEIQFDVNSQIYKIPTIKPERPDFTIQQDTVNKCWRLKLDDILQQNIKSQTVKFTSTLNFSITKKNDPHTLHKFFVVDLATIQDNDFSVPFDSDFELDVDNISVYTTKRLETYYHEVLV